MSAIRRRVGRVLRRLGLRGRSTRYQVDREPLRADRAALRRQRSELQASTDRLSTQLDAAQSQIKQLLDRSSSPGVFLTEGRTVDDLGYVFIVTYGRSGSTLLQGILNSIPGYDIHGENRDSLYHLFKFHQTLESERIKNTRSEPLDPTNAWYGIDKYDPAQAIRDMRRLVVQTVLCPSGDTRVVGYKEIRWWHRDWQSYLRFLRVLLPNARFVLNTRSHEGVLHSKWWRRMQNPQARLAQYEKQMDEMAAYLGDAAFRVHYDDYIADPSTLRPLYDWLGEAFDEKRISDVLKRRHSY